jgi:hypothetical protein
VPLRWTALASAFVVAGLLAFPLFTQATSQLSASVALSDVTGGAQRSANATVTMHPRNAADGATWLTATAWQGGGRLVVEHLREVAPGVFKTTKPVPLYGEWKTMIRLHKGNAILGLPLYAPADPAIPVPGVAAPARFERPFFSDHELLQRESKTREAWITWGAYLTVLICTLGLLAALAWGLHRVGVTAGKRRIPAQRYLQPNEPEPDVEPDPYAVEPEPLPEPIWPAHFPTYAGRP